MCHADTWQRVDLYLIDWSVETRVSLKPDDVRRTSKFRRTFDKDISEIVRSLGLDQLVIAKNKDREDARLVIDLFTDNGVRTTYYASSFNLCAADNGLKHPIDKSFRGRFEGLAKGLKQP